MKKFDENVKKQLEENGLLDKVLEVGWYYLQDLKKGGAK